MKIYYNTVTDELKDKMVSKTLNTEELCGIKDTIIRDYALLLKPKRKSLLSLLISLVSILIIILLISLVGEGKMIHILNGSREAKTVGMIVIGLFALFMISILVAGFYAFKYLPYIYVGHMTQLLKKHYPEEIEDVMKEVKRQ